MNDGISGEQKEESYIKLKKEKIIFDLYNQNLESRLTISTSRKKNMEDQNLNYNIWS